MAFFFNIFSWQLWLCIFGIYSTFVVLAYSLNRMATSKEHADGFGTTVWLTAGSLLCRGSGPQGRYVDHDSGILYSTKSSGRR